MAISATRPVLSLLCLCALWVSVCMGNTQTATQVSQTIFWQTIGGYVVIGVIIIVFGGGVSLVAFLVCACHEKLTKKKRVHQMDLTSGTGASQPPDWAQRLVVLPELANQGFGLMSDGMQRVDTYHVIRHRKGDKVSDAARWEVPLVKGKHLFEVIWAWGQRGRHSAVGLGTDKVKLKANGSRSLVGRDDQSWGLDIVARRVYHKSRFVGGGQYPPDGSFVPDRFLMYVDMDNGRLGFGTDVTFWGWVVDGLNAAGSRPLFVMACTDKWQAGIRVYYKGSENPDTPNPFAQNAMMSTYAMPPPPGPAYPPVPPPPSYIEVEPSTSRPKGGNPSTLQQDVPPSAPPPYTAEGPPKY